jgi:transposase-like protein
VRLKIGGQSTRIGVYKCYQCRKRFSVRVGTVFEDSHVSIRLWLQAIYLLCDQEAEAMAQPADPQSVLEAIKETHAEAEQIGGSADGPLGAA